MKKGQIFNLSFKYKWFVDYSWHVYSKEVSGGLCKACALFDKSTTNRGILVKMFFKTLTNPRI